MILSPPCDTPDIRIFVFSDLRFKELLLYVIPEHTTLGNTLPSTTHYPRQHTRPTLDKFILASKKFYAFKFSR